MKIHIAAAILIFPLCARAQQPPMECTTTIHCTGDAAPYAVPQAEEAPPPTVIVLPAAAPTYPTYPAYPTYPTSYPQLDLNKLESDGWKLTHREDGSLWRERTRSTASGGVWGTGLALFGISWLASGVAGFTNGETGPVGFIPVLGAWINAGVAGSRSCDYYYCSDQRTATALWAIDGLVQAGGFIMLLVGMSSGPKKVERQPVMVAPGLIGTGPGLSAIGRF